MGSRKGWRVGVNAPGYLPDQDPTVHPTFTDAFFELQRQLVDTREILYDDASPAADEELQYASDQASEYSKTDKEGFQVTLMGIVHWIERVS